MAKEEAWKKFVEDHPEMNTDVGEAAFEAGWQSQFALEEIERLKAALREIASKCPDMTDGEIRDLIETESR